MEIYPDHIYGGVPVFKPTWDQFKDFRTFVTSVKSYGYNSGIVKIIPPAEWKAILPKDLSPQLNKILIRNPCQQIIQRDTTVGYYVVRNVESEQTFTIKEWAELCETPEHSTPFPKSKTNSKSSVSDYLPLRKKKKHNGKSTKKNSTIVKRNQGSTNQQITPKISQLKKNNLTVTSTPPETPPKARNPGTNKETNKTCVISSQDTTSDESEIEEEEVILTSDQMESAVDAMQLDDEEYEEIYEKFDYHSVNRRPYDDENYIKELAANYWKTIMYNYPYYGADMAGTLFTEKTTSWNVNSLDNLLNTIDPIPGVNDAYLYFGMWKACFPWHVEDKDLYSINYIHFGAPKHWYAISPKKADQFESHMRGWFGSDSKNCSEFLRHKEFLASPRVLDRAPIQYNYVIQREGEFIITFPRGYHAGFNLGFNCAESVNFAFEDWIPLGIGAKTCACRPDSMSSGTSSEKTKIKLQSSSIGPSSSSTKIVLNAKKRKLKINSKKIETYEGGEFELISKDDGTKYAHGLCAMFVPETWIASSDGSVNDCKIIETEPIPKYRFETECQICHTKKGACVKCQEEEFSRFMWRFGWQSIKRN
ncbi:10190_t:CDS:10 [Diversispora eburnea]|uniref:10190_t:CDS:1 n=1 Tax=Diversispora eburnea TaxID=1213867 RepID=A0A9N8ZNT7_9GLOM|nr:10190_t:CDS:10 [Diversispora eburnea]